MPKIDLQIKLPKMDKDDVERYASWQADVTFMVLDETITEDVFRYHLEQAGAFMGIGRFRPQVGGYYGRFAVGELITAS